MSQERKANPVKKYGVLAAMTMLMALLMLPIVLDVFTHGYFCDETSYGLVPPGDDMGTFDLKDGPYTMTFSPVYKHFRGFEVVLANQPEGNRGQLVLTITDEKGAFVDELVEDLEKIHENQWYKTYLHKNLKAGKLYYLEIRAENCQTYPHLYFVWGNHIGPETLSGYLLLGYAYGESTFSGVMKAGIFFLLALIWCFVAAELFLPKERKPVVRKAFACLLLGLLLLSNYILYYLDSPEVISAKFDAGSEKLVTNAIETTAEMDGYGLTIEEEGVYTPYKSQFGLQGHVFRALGGLFTDTRSLRALSAAAAAAVFMGIVLVLRQKYNTLLAGCFYITFLLSPWVVNFAANLYWLEFTWFLPMLLGLVCAWKLDSKTARLLCYAGAFVSLFVKCLCGYEYVSTIMAGMVAFPLADLVCAFASKDKKRAKQLFLSAFFLGACAVAGFVAALLVHAQLKGEGNLTTGIRLIIEQDVLRRTAGGDMNQFDPVYWPSFNASVPETLHLYLQFDTEILTGIPGNLFPLLSLLPLAVFAVDWYHSRLSLRDASLYVLFALAAVSWFVLAKSHSFIHTNLNFVLWYFGFVQICFYILLDKLVSKIGRGERI